MRNGSPTVSVLMPVYNGLPYLTEALDDLLAQTLADFELVVVDDASTDGTSDVLDDYAARDGRIVVIRNEKNLGLPRSLNRGLERCRASLVARADDDDRYAPDRLKRQVAFMNAHPEVGLASCACHKIDEEGERFLTVHHPTTDGRIRIRELFVNSFSHPGVIFRKELVLSVGGYDPEYWTSEDADLWARLRPHTRMANLEEPLLAYRKHGSSMVQSRNSEGAALSLSVRQRLLEAYLGEPFDLEETRVISEMYRGNPVAGDQIDLGRNVLRDVLRKAEQRETAEAVAFYRRTTARALLRQAAYHDSENREVSRSLFLEAVRWDPTLLLSPETTKQGVKSTFPTPTVTLMRHAASGTRKLLHNVRNQTRNVIQRVLHGRGVAS